MVSKFIRLICLAFLLILPISRDGPLNLDLGLLKFFIALGLAIAAFPLSAKLLISHAYQRSSYLIVLLSLVVLTAFLFCEVKSLSLDFTLYFFTSILMFFVYSRLFDTTFIRKATSILLLLTFLSCGLAITQFIVIKYRIYDPFFVSLIPIEFRSGLLGLQRQPDPIIVRLPSFFYHNNGFGQFLSAVFGFQFSMLLHSTKRIESTLYALAAFLILISTLLTLSRGTALVIAVEALLIMYLLRHTLTKKIIPLALVGMFIALASAYFLETNIVLFFERMISSGLSYRDISWNYALKLIPDHFLLGTGPGTSSYYILTSFPFIKEYLWKMISDLSMMERLDWHMSHAHNFFLNTILETGVFSLIVYIILFLTIIHKGLQIYLQSNRALVKTLSVGATVPLIGCALRGIFESHVFFDSPDVGFLVAFFAALIFFLDSQKVERLPKRRSTQFYPEPFSNL